MPMLIAESHGNPPARPSPPKAPGGSARARRMETRYGALTIEREDMIQMPAGPLGFEERQHFALVPFPDPRFSRFRLFQCVDDADLSFIVVPYDPESGEYEAAELEEAAAALGTTAEAVTLYLIVTVRSTAEGPILTCNLRAPLVVDQPARIARQCVLSGMRHSIRHPLA